MRYLLAAALVLFACSPGPAGPAGPAGPRGEPGEGVDVGALVAEVERLRGELEAMRGARVKVPHIIARESGEDLGVYLDADVVYSETVGAAVRWPAAELFFESDDCTGQPYAGFVAMPRPAAYAIGATGRLFTVKPVGREVPMRSYFGAGNPCSPSASRQQAFAEDAGMSMTVALRDSVIVELR